MTPIEFVVFEGDSNPNQPVCEIAEAMHKPIEIHSSGAEWEVIGYYYGEEGRMVLDIKEKSA
jgi:hypothetical protein